MIHAFHSVFSRYGFWLPNDPRGSGSDYVAAWELFRDGPATKTTSRRSVAAKPHDRALRLAAKGDLKYPPIVMTGIQAVIIAQGFAKACNECGYRIHALAILPEHVHAVIGWHRRDIRKIVGHLKSKATMVLRIGGHWPDADRPVWGDHG